MRSIDPILLKGLRFGQPRPGGGPDRGAGSGRQRKAAGC